jgi:hypothetical protein
MLFNQHSWSWDDNPFVGVPQLNGLKIVNMLLSNWDTKIAVMSREAGETWTDSRRRRPAL